MKIYISGLYSGTNPQPGVGIARSLRAAYPDATLIGVEYSNRCSGIHWEDFDDIWLQRPWEELNLDVHGVDIKRVLDSGDLWISSIDLEIMWLASILPDGHPNLLTPPLTAVDAVGKPAIPAHKGLPVKIPTFVTTEISDWDLHTFCRENDWRVWLKGPYYEAVHTPSWAEFEAKRNILSKAWATEKLFLQRHVTGYEESVCISAYRGELLDCVLMRKRDLTEIGKTWAGDISPVDEDFLIPLRKILRRIKWTGGAEIEMVRDADDVRWLLEWNPRYPAWIHGATITGRNLPAALVEGCTGIPPTEPTVESEEFTRVVLEIPVRREYPLGPLPEPLGGYMGHSLKHPSGLLQFADRLHKEARHKTAELNYGHMPIVDAETELGKIELPGSYLSDLDRLDISPLDTPVGVFMAATAAEYFEEAAKTADRVSTREITVTNAYSLKTDPDRGWSSSLSIRASLQKR